MKARCDLTSERGGCALGRSLLLSVTWPARLQTCSDSLVLEVLWRSYTFPRESIVRLVVMPVIFWRIIQIEHSIAEYPRFVGFRAASFSRLRQLLLDASFQTNDKWPNTSVQRTRSAVTLAAPNPQTCRQPARLLRASLTCLR